MYIWTVLYIIFNEYSTLKKEMLEEFRILISCFINNISTIMYELRTNVFE